MKRRKERKIKKPEISSSNAAQPKRDQNMISSANTSSSPVNKTLKKEKEKEKDKEKEKVSENKIRK